MGKVLDGIVGYCWLMLTGMLSLIFFKVLNRTEVVGKENLPYQEGVLIVSNHRSMIDSFLVGGVAYFPRAIFKPQLIPWHAAAYENFFFNPLLAWMSSHWKCIPVKRGQQDLEAQAKMTEVLENGTLMIFPEGTRSRTGKLLPARPGVGRIIYRTHPVTIPVYFSGMEKVLPIGSFIPRIFQKIKVIFGKPLDFNNFLEFPDKKETWQAISDQTMTEIAHLKSQIENT